MNLKKSYSRFGSTVCVAVLFLFSYVSADVKIQAENLLSVIKNYDYGQSREPLTQFAELIRNSIDSPADKQVLETCMLNMLGAEATFAGKQFICQQLSLIGTEKTIPTLEPLLKDEKTSDIARYALERIPGKRVNEVLRTAMSKARGKIRIGIINTLGERKDSESVAAFGKLLYDADKTTAISAAAALGKIADNNSLEILAEAVDRTREEVQLAVLNSYLKCADAQANAGAVAQATSIYQTLLGDKYALPIRSAALHGLVAVSGENAGKLIQQMLAKKDEPLKATAIMLVRDLPAHLSVQDIAAYLPTLDVTGKVQLLTALQDRKDFSVHDQVIKATGDEDVHVRIAAYTALTTLGNEQDVLLLATAAARGEAIEKESARETLALLSGAKVDETILALLPTAEPDIQAELIASIGSRNNTSATDMLLQTATSANPEIRNQSIKALELLASPDYLDKLVDLLINVQSPLERRRAENAVIAVAHKIDHQSEQAAEVLKKLPAVKDEEARCSLLRVLGNIGDSNALPILRASLSDKNENIQKAAIQALSDWPTSAPLNDLLSVINNSKNEIHQTLALRGYIRLIGLESDRNDSQTIQLYLKAMELAQHANEKKMVLSGLSNVRTPEALKLTAAYLSDATLKEEAEVALIRIAGRTRGNFPAETKEVLLKVIKSTTNKEVMEDARRYLEEMAK